MTQYTDQVKKCQTENGCSYRQAQGILKGSGVQFKQVARKAKNTVKKIRKNASKINNHLTENREFINLLGGDKLTNAIDKGQDKYAKVNSELKNMETAIREGDSGITGGGVSKKAVYRKIKNTAKAVRNTAKKLAPALSLIDPELGLMLDAGLAVTGGSVKRSYKRTGRYSNILKKHGGSFATPASYNGVGGSFATPMSFGGGLTINSTMVHKSHHSFNPPKPKPVYVRNYTN
jgi:hypothetical protein